MYDIERANFSVSSYSIGDHDDEAAEAAAAAVAWGAYRKNVRRLTILTLIPLAADILVYAWIALCAFRALRLLPAWAGWFGGAALLALIAFMIITVMQWQAKDTAMTPPPPSLSELNAGSEWLWRITNAPIVPLSIIYLDHIGWHPAAACTAAAIGWLGQDLASLLNFLPFALSIASPT